MTDAMDFCEEAEELVMELQDIFAGMPNDVVGAALCESVALFVAGYSPQDRPRMLDLQFATTRLLLANYTRLTTQ